MLITKILRTLAMKILCINWVSQTVEQFIVMPFNLLRLTHQMLCLIPIIRKYQSTCNLSQWCNVVKPFVLAKRNGKLCRPLSWRIPLPRLSEMCSCRRHQKTCVAPPYSRRNVWGPPRFAAIETFFHAETSKWWILWLNSWLLNRFCELLLHRLSITISNLKGTSEFDLSRVCLLEMLIIITLNIIWWYYTILEETRRKVSVLAACDQVWGAVAEWLACQLLDL